jgi:soluble lytic murein transglycosylase-like protein
MEAMEAQGHLMSDLIHRFGSPQLALAAYNAGPTAVQNAGGPPSRGVQAYVSNVTNLWRSLAGCS